MTATKEQRFVALDIRNVMGIKTAHIPRKGSVTTIGGKNGAGKSTAIKTLWMILGGAAATPESPLREGTTKGGATLELTDYICDLTVSEKSGTRVKVTPKDGSPPPPPATFLRSLTAGKAFNPMSFYAEKPDRQLEILRALVDLDTSEIDKESAAKYERRTAVNHQCRDLQAQLDAAVHHEGVPEAEVSVVELSDELERRRMANHANEGKRSQLAALRQRAGQASDEVARLEKALSEAKAVLAKLQQDGLALRAEVDALVDLDVGELRAEAAGTEETNRKVRANAEYTRLSAAFEGACSESQDLTQAIAALDERKKAAIAAAKFPVPGLGFGAGCVLYNGRPLDQACGMERMRVSLAIGMALNPGLKLLAIDNGEAFDDGQHAAIAALAEESKFDLIIARVGTGPECSIILQDGEVVAAV